MMAGNKLPDGWLLCDGSMLRISEYQVLYSVIEKKFGGDGRETFQLPDLRGRFPIGVGEVSGQPAYQRGNPGGRHAAVLSEDHLPKHSHTIEIKNPLAVKMPASAGFGTSYAPGPGAVPAKIDDTTGADTYKAYGAADNATYLSAEITQAEISAAEFKAGEAGGGHGFSILPPYVGLYYMICVNSEYPTGETIPEKEQ